MKKEMEEKKHQASLFKQDKKSKSQIEQEIALANRQKVQIQKLEEIKRNKPKVN